MERGSFITQYIDCKVCLKSVRQILLKANHPKIYFQDIALHSPKGMDVKYIPIIAGYIPITESLMALSYFENIRKEIEDAICMDLYIAILSNDINGRKIMAYTAKQGVMHIKKYKGKKE